MQKGFLSLCYHYVRPPKEKDPAPRLLGQSEVDFNAHVEMLKKNYSLIDLKDVEPFLAGQPSRLNGRTGMLITFDDALSDHFRAAEILSEYKAPAVFFIPTCVLKDQLPANPTIVHYCLSLYKINEFLDVYRAGLEEMKIDVATHDIAFTSGQTDPWDTIKKIKSNFRYNLTYQESRQVLLFIYRNLLLKNNPDVLKQMHLTHDQVRKMLEMGHSIGVHSHSHISVASSSLSPEDFDYEIIQPKKYLEQEFKTPVTALSYPFGGKKDCLDAKGLITQTNEYKMAFTVEEILNTQTTSSFELGRLMPMSQDSAGQLKDKLDAIEAKSRG